MTNKRQLKKPLYMPRSIAFYVSLHKDIEKIAEAESRTFHNTTLVLLAEAVDARRKIGGH